MAATTMAFNDLLKQLRRNLPNLTFCTSDTFRWSSSDQTVYYAPEEANAAITLLHETGHGLLDHLSYTYDIDLLKLERDAWQEARILGDTYGVSIDNETVENALDTYRDWLHTRSTCPNCAQNGVQTGENRYTCIVCDQTWHVNDARTCGLKRTKIAK